MRQLAQLMHAFYQQPLLMPTDLARQIDDVLRRKVGGASFDGAALHAELGIAMPRQRSAAREPPTVAVIPIHGMITQHANSMGTSTDEIGAMLDGAMGNSQVDAIILDVDSPGGAVTGVPELASRIAAANEKKPIVAYANGLMASAAYWLSAGASEIVAMPTSFIGSIGVVWAHRDESEQLANEGVRITTISAGKYKTEGSPFAPFSAEAAGHMQAIVDKVYKWFVKAVAAGRGDTQANVISGYGEGRVLLGEDAVQAKLADRVASFEDTVLRLATRVQRSTRRGASAALLGKRLDLDADPLIS